MTDKFRNELPQRILKARPDADQESFALYVHLMCLLLGMDRATLAQQANLDRSLLDFLAIGLLTSDELKEVRERIEKAGVPCPVFRRLIEQIMTDLQPDWGYSRSVKVETSRGFVRTIASKILLIVGKLKTLIESGIGYKGGEIMV
jgi:hypothetical protein